jgi:hypothetical protein
MVEEYTVGDPWIRLEDGSSFLVGPGKLHTPDGESFGIDWEIGQDAEGAPIHASMRIVADDPREVSEDARRETWLAAHDGASEADFNQWDSARRDRGLFPEPAPASVDTELEQVAFADPERHVEGLVVLRGGARVELPIASGRDSRH